MTLDIDPVRLVAHELRAPLAVIRGYLAMLSDGTFPVPPETRRGAVDIVAAKALELDHLIERWLVEPRRARTADIDIGAAAGEAIDRLRPRARLKSASVYFARPRRQAVARGDRDHVARILDNLLNNAIDHSPRPARVAVEVREGVAVEVVVRDSGRGIPQADRDAIFRPFFRGTGGGGGLGLGLGLAISRQLASLDGGTLVLAESAPGRGSTFVLRLPAAGRA